ncbi:DUF4262 domain-containing protein [Hymenobacter sp. BRD128]|uniref:DUF4262 domain-containing protein n=1 Tax=Hymenobacter sp. BRD128 TaxID=2675878 RepID=UPI0015666DC5|nr:DUF4262 domain-containing protein [Hymenobacter sp. BRD128]QKG55948.1 DUF4262 domain-containing protein [Hymenobacter sp. BRD128]
MATPEEHAEHDAAAEKIIISDVEKYGFHVAQIKSDGYSPSFSYTIGLFKTYGYPELICFGLNLDLLHSVLWSGKKLLDRQPLPDQSIGYPDFLDDYDVRFLTVNKDWYRYYFGYGIWFNQGLEFPALQIIWPDKQALYPWEEGFNPAWKAGQPLLDRNLDFKFREERNVAVFTTRQVLEGLPILRVIHEVNGDWQFLCDTTYEIDDLKIVALEQLTKRDPTINDLFQLNYGWQAQRIVEAAEWQEEEYQPEEEEEDND